MRVAVSYSKADLILGNINNLFKNIKLNSFVYEKSKKMSAKSLGSSLIDFLVQSEIIELIEPSFEIPGAVSPKNDQFSNEWPPSKNSTFKAVFCFKILL